MFHDDNLKQGLKRNIILLFWTALSSAIYAISLTTFSIPGKLYPGGVSGISRIAVDVLRDYFAISIPFGVIYGGTNFLLTIFVFKKIGKRFATFSVIQFLLVSFFSLFFPKIIQVDDPLLFAVFGGIVAGLSISLVLVHDVSSGGFDFVAMYVANRYHIQVWNHIMAANSVILCAWLLYGWEKALYSIILQFCQPQVINRLHKRYRLLTLTIITTIPEEVEASILSCVRHGITEFKTKGGYFRQDNSVLSIVISSYQERDVVQAVLRADKHAFINIQETRKVVGNYYHKPLD